MIELVSPNGMRDAPRVLFCSASTVRRVALIAIVGLVLARVEVATAGNIAVMLNAPPSENGVAADPSRVEAWEFTPTVNISVTSLGVLNYSFSTPFALGQGLSDAHPVGIWSLSNTASPIVSATVPSGTSAGIIDDIRFVPITPTLLLSGDTYVIGAYYPTTNDGLALDNNPFPLCVFDPLLDVGSESLYAVNAGDLVFPNINTHSNYGELGPSFQFAPVPEPSTIALFGSALLGLGAVYLRRQIARG